MNRLIVIVSALALTACSMSGSEKDNSAKSADMPTAADPAPATTETMSLDEGRYGVKMDKKAKRKPSPKGQSVDQTASLAMDLAPEAEEEPSDDSGPGGGGQGGERGPATRSWFPETFLFEPLVITDARGVASIKARVPDRLTTWRVLGLAHSRTGAQAGTVTSFLGTLPAYVELVVPPLLRAGDTLRLPVQVVNTTPEPIAGALKIEAAGAKLTGGDQAVTVPGRSSLVRYVTLSDIRPGQIRIKARFGDTDAVLRTIDVEPTGRPVTQSRSGTLAAPRSFVMVGPADAAAGLDRVTLHVFPGALALLRSELAASIHRGGVAHDAFAMLLAGKAPELLRSFGDTPDTDALRDLTLLTTQRVVRHARVLDINSATLLADAALAHKDNAVLSRLGERAVAHIKANQVPDGTCGGDNGWTLQRLLVATADCARAASREQGVVIRASGAFERHRDHIKDPYTAAAILASGAATGEFADVLRQQVRDAIAPTTDGAQAVTVPGGVVRADGAVPSTVEATALAVLALRGDAQAPLADLGATILSGYSPGLGWGDGRANLVCMQAALELFKDPVPDHIEIALAMDGKPLAQGTLDRERVREVLTLQASQITASGAHPWTVTATPPVPGLGYALTLTSYVPWPDQPANQGVEFTLTPPDNATVGAAAELMLRAVVPDGQTFEIALGLPAGVQADSNQLDELVSSGTIQRYNLSDGKIELWAGPLDPAQMFTAGIRLIPTLAGSLHSGPASLDISGVTVQKPPVVWTIK